MSLKFSTLSLAVVAALQSPLALANEVSNGNIERIEVKGRSFNEYKVGAANGAMRGDMSLLETPQSVSVIPDFVTDEQLATNLAEVLVNDSSITSGSQR